ncbi:unnamed protein product [marine sediment metagenome]|uniref:Uncharacterized protein n=1 Tax=marine sediment metagenome TaxID=412755 RepID=X1D1D7_9ZZZZ
MIFGSGKIVITGAKFEDQVPEAAKKIMGRLYDLDLLDIEKIDVYDDDDW